MLVVAQHGLLLDSYSQKKIGSCGFAACLFFYVSLFGVSCRDSYLVFRWYVFVLVLFCGVVFCSPRDFFVVISLWWSFCGFVALHPLGTNVIPIGFYKLGNLRPRLVRVLLYLLSTIYCLLSTLITIATSLHFLRRNGKGKVKK